MRKPVIGVTSNIETGDEARPIRPNRRHLYLDLDYAYAIREAGGLPMVLTPVAEADLDVVLDAVDGLLIPGGGDLSPETVGQDSETLYSVNLERERFELPLIRKALERDMPLLGVCYGIQVVNLLEGGTLIVDLAEGGLSGVDHGAPVGKRRAEHPVEIELNSRVGAAFGAVGAKILSCHHQGVGELAPGYRASARSADGLIEAIEADSRRWVVGVQWHPESMAAKGCAASRRLFADFVAASSS